MGEEKECIVNGSGDLAMRLEAREFINQRCVILKKTRAGLFMVALKSNTKHIISLPLYNIDIDEEVYYG